jgi:hypothetical protein
MHEIWTQGADFGRILPIFAEDRAQTAAVNCDYADGQIRQMNGQVAASDGHLTG